MWDGSIFISSSKYSTRIKPWNPTQPTFIQIDMHSVKYVLALALSVYAVHTYSSALSQVFERDATSVVARSYGGHLQFLTILSIVVSLLHQSLSVLSLLTGLRTLNALQSWVLIVSAPLEVVVALLYWPLKYFNNDLVKDKRFGLVINPALDRQCHLYPAIFEFLSATFLAQRRWRTPAFVAVFVFLTTSGAYWAWFEYTFKKNAFYPYPLLSLLTTGQKAGLVLVATVVAFVFFRLVQVIQRSLY